MGEFHDCVSTLLDAFARGIGIIKVQRRRRKQEQLSINSTHKTAEAQLSKSLKKNRLQVKDAYGRDLSRYGNDFAAGDAEAHSSLSAVLFRLNAGFVSVIERFTRGRSSPADYQALVNLSNTSRMEAIQTFEQLSNRLSRSSLALVPVNKKSHGHRTGHKRNTSRTSTGHSQHSKHARSKSAPELSITALGPATAEGWVRPKPGRKLSSDSKTSTSSGSSSPKRSMVSKRSSQNPPPYSKSTSSSPKAIMAPQPQPGSVVLPPPTPRTRPENRQSIMTFASDSTKIGEIPEHKWARPGMFESENANFPITAYYPMEPYQEPEKPRSRFFRLFRR